MNNTGKKFGGRTKGTPNRATSEMRQRINEMVNGQMENINAYFEAIEKPETKIKLLIDLLPYCISKVQTEHSGQISKIQIVRDGIEVIVPGDEDDG